MAQQSIKLFFGFETHGRPTSVSREALSTSLAVHVAVEYGGMGVAAGADRPGVAEVRRNLL
jgi:hypothetical protein